MNDFEIWNQFKNGSEAAFAQIYRQHAKMLYGYGMKLIRDTELVEDCIHDLFIELWDRKAHLGCTDSIKLYLLKGLKRKVLRVLSNNRKNAGNSLSISADYETNVVFSHETILILNQFTSEQEHRLKQGIEKLSENQREIIFLRFYANLSYEEISNLMDINYQSVKNLMFRSMKSLRKELATSLISLLAIFALFA